MSVDDIKEPFRELLACFEAFRRVSIPAEDVFVGVQPGGARSKTKAFIVARRAELSFTIGCEAEDCPDDADAFAAAWEAAATWWNAAEDAKIRDIWENSLVRARLPSLIREMQKKGFMFGNEAAK